MFALASAILTASCCRPAKTILPAYLDEEKPLEVRVEDALSRMTLEEKVKILHAQSKFSSAGVPRLGISELWTTDGPHGIRPEVLWDEWSQVMEKRLMCGFPGIDRACSHMERGYGGSLR